MVVEDKFYVEEYDLFSQYFKSDFPKKIVVASDIHYQSSVSKDLFTMIVKYAEEVRPDFIVMPGDQIETIDFIDDSKSRIFFERIIDDLSKIAPLIIIPGNHEIKNFSKENFSKRLDLDDDVKEDNRAISYFTALSERENVYFLNNEQVTLNGVTFLGFNPRLNSYLKINDKKIEEEFVEDYLNSSLKMAQDGYNILLTHSPLQLTSNGVFNSISDFSNLTDLVITGHLHDGYLPKKMDKWFGQTNAGLFLTPLVAPYPGVLCRGVHDFGRGYLFISQGYRKWTPDLKITNFFEKFTANDIAKLVLSKGEKSVISHGESKPYSRK